MSAENIYLAPAYVNSIRFGRNVSPSWIYGAEITAPASGTTLVSRAVSSGKNGYIYGFYISAGEGNSFRLRWVSRGTTYTIMVVFPGPGSIQYADFIALNEGLPADGNTTITITNVNVGGSVYQAGILYAEV